MAYALMSPHRWTAALQMMRPANIVTAWADILVGVSATGCIPTSVTLHETQTSFIALLYLLIATTGLYGGGVVFNDVFDAELDAIERPERPIPSGRASVRFGIALGSGLLILGVVAALQVSYLSGAIALSIALLALFYDAIGKHHPIVGPLNMGCCRGGNWLLGVSLISPMVLEHWFMALIPILYIAAITAISRGEVHGGDRLTGSLAIGLLGLVSLGLISLGLISFWGGSSGQTIHYSLLFMLPFALLWGYWVFPAFIQAARNPDADLIRNAVRTGIIALIALDSAIVSGFSHWGYGLLVLALMPLSKMLAQQFSVT
jgi:4-hydroxybenzoate polyprenyltransferase